MYSSAKETHSHLSPGALAWNSISACHDIAAVDLPEPQEGHLIPVPDHLHIPLGLMAYPGMSI